MAEKHGTAIEWTHGEGRKGETWNPVQGCSKVSPGCAMCYAETLTKRHAGSPGWIAEHRPWTPENAEHNVRLRPDKLDVPLHWRKPRMVFVNSMSDLFHEDIPDDYIDRVFAVMALAERHTFQVLTKRPERMRAYLCDWRTEDRVSDIAWDLPWPRDLSPEMQVALGRDRLAHHWPSRNVWLGVSIENRRFIHRADLLRETPAAVRFVSAEPLLGPLVADGQRYGEWWEWADGYEGSDLSLRGIDWLICGGESGPKHRRFDLAWARDLRDACRDSGTAFFVKQLGGSKPGSKLEDLPEDLRIREMPKVGVHA